MKNKTTKKKLLTEGMGMEEQLGGGMMSLDGPMSSQSTGAFQRIPGAGVMGGMAMNQEGAKAMAAKKQKPKGLKR